MGAAVDVSGVVYTGLVSGDALAASSTGAFSDKNVGIGKAITLAYAGADVGNYTITSPSLTADITRKSLGVYGFVGRDKVYDSTSTATISISGYDGRVNGDDVQLSATANFVNGYGRRVENVGTHSHVIVVLNGLTGTDAGNYTLENQGAWVTGGGASITQRALTVSEVAVSNKVYDGTVIAPVSATYEGLVSGDDVLVSGVFSDKNAGTDKAVALSYTGGDAGNYNFTAALSGNETASVTQRALTVSEVAVSDKIYDGTASAAVDVSGVVYTGLVSGDALVASSTGAFSDKNVGAAKTVTLTNVYSGADVSNYAITGPSNTTASITPKGLTVSGITASDKIYDGSVSAAVDVSGVVYTGLVSGDALAASSTGAFSDKNVGAAKTVTLTNVYSGADVSNYAITGPSNTTASITPKGLTVSGITASDKIYDGSASAAVDVSGVVYTGLVSGDALAASSTGAFSDKNVGAAKTVTLTNVYSGADVSNYAITGPSNTTASITPKGLTVSGITASDKIYDGSVSAAVDVSGVVYTGLVSGDALVASVTGAFSDKNVGAVKTVTLTNVYSGADVSNYAITGPSNTTASITPKGLTVSGITASDKIYDGSVSAAVDVSGVVYTGLVSGDALAASVTGAFSDKNIGAAKTVTLTNVYSGADVSNYAITGPSNTTASITPKRLTVSGITAFNKVYDGATNAKIDTRKAVYTGLVSGDALEALVTGAFSDKNVGAAKAVTLTNVYSGADVSNYTITGPSNTTASITPKKLTLSGIRAFNKVYNGVTNVKIDTRKAVYAGLVSGDHVKVWAEGTFGNKNAGKNKTVALKSTYVGSDVRNYTIADQSSTRASISRKTLKVTGITARNKTYDGTDHAVVNTNLAVYRGLIRGDNVYLSSVDGRFADSNVGDDKSVSLYNHDYSGVDFSNYNVISQRTTSADILSAKPQLRPQRWWWRWW